MDERRAGVVTVKVNGTPLAARLYDALVEVKVEQSVYVPDRFILRFGDPGLELFDKGFLDGSVFSVGAAVDVFFTEQGADVSVIQAEVTQVAVDLEADDRQELVVTGLDRGHRLARGTKVRSFVSQTAADLARQIAKEHGLAADVDSSPVVYEYLLQSSTDYAFLTERARSAGFDWWVSDKTLHFKSATSTVTSPVLTWGENLRQFKMRYSAAEAAEEVQVQAWDPTSQREVVGSAKMGLASADGVALATTAPVAEALMSSAVRSRAFTGTRFTGAAPVASPQEANALARSLAQQASSEQLVARGEAVGCPKMGAGTEVQMAKLGAKLSGTWRLSTVEHVLTERSPYRTRFTSGGKQSHSLVDLLGAGSAGAPVGAASSWGAVGLVVGIVTNNNDPEKLSRVKVKFPSLGERDESAWARVVSVGAGTTRGLHVLPDVNDEVLVGFEHGDRRRPLVLGGLWSAKQASPVHGNIAGEGGGVWQSRVGHAIAMSDGTGPTSRFIALTLANGKGELHLGEDEVRLGAAAAVTVSSDKTVTIKATGDLTLEANNITLKAQGKLAMEATTTETKAKVSSKTDAAMVEINAKGSAKVVSAGVTEVKGSLLKLN
jgi:uncharacterized protein involved in type VI secretion and phage assembly